MSRSLRSSAHLASDHCGERGPDPVQLALETPRVELAPAADPEHPGAPLDRQLAPENVLAALNRDGEVVVEATYRGTPYYVKILATARGLKVEVIDR